MKDGFTLTRKLINHGTQIAKNCKLAPVIPFMPRLDDFIFAFVGRGCDPVSGTGLVTIKLIL
jgi:hypothetical protein